MYLGPSRDTSSPGYLLPLCKSREKLRHSCGSKSSKEFQLTVSGSTKFELVQICLACVWMLCSAFSCCRLWDLIPHPNQTWPGSGGFEGRQQKVSHVLGLVWVCRRGTSHGAKVSQAATRPSLDLEGRHWSVLFYIYIINNLLTFVSYGCYDWLPPTWWLNTTQINFLTFKSKTSFI